MKVYLRGIPHFGFVLPQEIESLGDFLASLDLRVSIGIFEAKVDYYLGKKRVMVYLERGDYLRDVQHPVELYLMADPEDCRVTRTGSGDIGNTDALLFVSPNNDPRFPALLDAAKEAARVKRAKEEEEEERQERLRERLLTLAEHIGVDASVDILQSKVKTK
jgi:hypothetical protein